MGKTLRGYLLREIAGAFLAGIAVFSSILFLLRVLDLIEMIFARGVPARLVLRLLAAILPSFVEAVMPMAFLLGVLLAFARLAADGETMALRAAGIGAKRVLPPVMAAAVAVALLTFALSMTARPWGHREIERTGFEIAKTRASAALRPRFFNTDFERMVVYVDRIEADSGDLVGVMLSDEREGARTTVFAKGGRLGGREDSSSLFLQLFDGTSVSSGTMSADYDVTSFRSLEVNLELRTATGSRPRSDEPAALTPVELLEDLGGAEQPRRLEANIELHRRLAISAAPLALAVLGVALGFAHAPGARGRAIGPGIAVILLFQAMLTLAVAAARAQVLPAGAAMWAPVAVLAGIAAWALSRSERDRPFLPALGRASTGNPR